MNVYVEIVRTGYLYSRVCGMVFFIGWLIYFSWVGRRVLFGYSVITRQRKIIRKRYSWEWKIAWAFGMVLSAFGIVYAGLTL